MKFLYLLVLFCLCGGALCAQVGIGTNTPNANAVLELKSPGNNQGFLVPRLTTTQRSTLSLTAAENGMMVYDSDENRFYYWQSTQWLPLRSGNDLQAGAGISITGNTISVVPDGDGNATNEIQDLQLNGNTLTITKNASATPIDLAPFAGTNTDNQTLAFNGGTGALSISGGNSVTLTEVVLQSETPTGGAISGTFAGGLQINNDAVTSAKILDGTIATNDIANNAVTAAKIPDAALSSAKLTTTGVTAGSYGSATVVPRVTVDAQGRITAASNVTIAGVAPGGAASGDLTGTYPAPTIAATAGSNVVTAINNASTTGTIATNRLNAGVVLDTESPAAADIAGTFATGLAINSNAVTTAKIANSAVTPAKIAPGAALQVLTTVAGVAAWANLPAIGTGTVTSITAGSGLTGGVISTTGTISLENTKVTPGSYGSATQIPTFTVDQQGRLQAAGSVAVSGGGGESLAETLKIGNDAGGQDAYNFKSLSINTGGSGPGALNVNGSHYVNFTMADDGYTVQPDDYIIINNTASKPVNVTLPDAAKSRGRILIFRSQGQDINNAMIVRSTQGVDGQAQSEPLYIDQNFSNNTAYAITLMSTGATWITISRSIGKGKG